MCEQCYQLLFLARERFRVNRHLGRDCVYLVQKTGTNLAVFVTNLRAFLCPSRSILLLCDGLFFLTALSVPQLSGFSLFDGKLQLMERSGFEHVCRLSPTI